MPGETQAGRSPGRRYSTFVGIAFLVLIVVATLNTIRTQGGGTSAWAGRAGHAAARVRGPGCAHGPAGQGRQHRPGRLLDLGESLPLRRAPRPPACEIHVKGAIRVCDLFDRPLVLSFWFTRGADCLPDPGRRRPGRLPLPWPRELPLDRRPRRSRPTVRRIVDERGWRIPVGYDRDGAVSDLYRVGGCPTVAFAYPGGILDFARVGTGELSRADAHRRRRAAAAPVSSAGARRAADGRGGRARGGLGQRPSCARSFPGLALRYLLIERGSGRTPRQREGAPRGALEQVLGPAGDQPAPPADPLGVPRLLPPHRARPRRAADPGRGGRPGAHEAGRVHQPEPARRRAHDRDHRVGSGPARLRRRPRPRAGSGSARRSRARRSRGVPASLPSGTLVIADEARPLALLFGAVAAGRGVNPRTKRTILVGRAGEGRARHRRRGGDLARRRRAAQLVGPLPRMRSTMARRRFRAKGGPRARGSAGDRGGRFVACAGRGPGRRAGRRGARRRPHRASRPPGPSPPDRRCSRGGSASCSPPPFPARGSSGGSARSAGLGCSGSPSWSGCATRSPRGCTRRRPSSAGEARSRTQNRGLVEAMIAEPAALPVGAGVQRGRRRARLPPLALPASLGHPGDADGLVARQAVLGLSVSQGASAP